MAAAYTPVRGPFLKHAFAKSVDKGEDAWLQQREVPSGAGMALAGPRRSCESCSLTRPAHCCCVLLCTVLAELCT